MLSFYLSFLYANRKYYDPQRLLCMSEYLFDVQRENSLSQKGILKRFSIDCYGEQQTLETMRKEKTENFVKNFLHQNSLKKINKKNLSLLT